MICTINKINIRRKKCFQRTDAFLQHFQCFQRSAASTYLESPIFQIIPQNFIKTHRKKQTIHSNNLPGIGFNIINDVHGKLCLKNEFSHLQS